MSDTQSAFCGRCREPKETFWRGGFIRNSAMWLTGVMCVLLPLATVLPSVMFGEYGRGKRLGFDSGFRAGECTEVCAARDEDLVRAALDGSCVCQTPYGELESRHIAHRQPDGEIFHITPTPTIETSSSTSTSTSP